MVKILNGQTIDGEHSLKIQKGEVKKNGQNIKIQKAPRCAVLARFRTVINDAESILEITAMTVRPPVETSILVGVLEAVLIVTTIGYMNGLYVPVN